VSAVDVLEGGVGHMIRRELLDAEAVVSESPVGDLRLLGRSSEQETLDAACQMSVKAALVEVNHDLLAAALARHLFTPARLQ
jgi:hypothetical protein